MLDKKSLGTSGGSLIHVAWNEYGPYTHPHAHLYLTTTHHL